MKTYAILNVGMSQATRIEADSFRFSSDGKVAFLDVGEEAIAAFPVDKLIAIVASDSLTKTDT